MRCAARYPWGSWTIKRGNRASRNQASQSGVLGARRGASHDTIAIPTNAARLNHRPVIEIKSISGSGVNPLSVIMDVSQYPVAAICNSAHQNHETFTVDA